MSIRIPATKLASSVYVVRLNYFGNTKFERLRAPNSGTNRRRPFGTNLKKAFTQETTFDALFRF